MTTDAIGRRTFCGAAAAMGTLGSPAWAAAPTRLDDVIGALRDLGDVERLAGEEGAAVAGAMLTARPSLAALREAVSRGCSLIVSPESPFYARPPRAAATGAMPPMMARTLAQDEASPALRAKRAFVAEHGLSVLRVTAVGDDGGAASAALADRLGWAAYRRPGLSPVYTPPGLTVSGLAELAHRRLAVTGGLRTIGTPDMRIASVLVVSGTARGVPTIQAMAGADALLTGDLREWEIVEYIHDSAEAGHPKALVAVGRILSEQPFVERCGAALRRSIPRLRIRVPAASDPFWRVQA